MAQSTAKSPRRRYRIPGAAAYGFLAPAGILVLLFFFIPALIVIFLSLTNLQTANFTSNFGVMARDYFVGTDNYRTLFNDQYLQRIFFNTLFYVFLTLTFFNVGMALLVSLLTTHIPRGSGFLFRALWMLPRITSPVVYVLIWKRLLAEPPFGIANQFNELLGIAPINYASEVPWMLIILVNGFVGVSFGMIIFTSAIESIPKDLLNASLVDGSNTLQRIRYIILPLLRWPLLFVTTYQTLSLLTSFEYILLLYPDGSPGVAYNTEVWALTAFRRALRNYFGNAQWGYGSAFAVVLVVVGVVLAILYMRFFRFDELVAEPRIEEL